MDNIRNFVIIAHIDHGKSTLADRLLEVTGTVEARKMRPQYLDRLELERERGITIKMAPVRMVYRPSTYDKQLLTNNQKQKAGGHTLLVASHQSLSSEYILNLIDTPGHSDFSYEVSRALHAVEGAVLLVDAAKGIQAQTLSNFRNAERAGLTIIGAVNKIDLFDAQSGGERAPQIKKAVRDLSGLLRVPEEDILLVSGKSGSGILDLLQRIIQKIPSPRIGPDDTAPRALIFDSLYDNHKGILAFVRVFGGTWRAGEEIALLARNVRCKIKEAGSFLPEFAPVGALEEGEIGYLATGLKEPDRIKIGDTVGKPSSHTEPLRGYREPQPVVFISFYPDGATEFDELARSFAKLRLNDAALSFEPEANEALGRGLKVGFLGQLHFEITASRLEDEFGLEFLTSFPSVAYRVREGGREHTITQARDLPMHPDAVFEPRITIDILTPSSYLNQVMTLTHAFALEIARIETIGENAVAHGTMPLAELLRDFDDRLKSLSQGYASFSYELGEYAPAEVEKLEILVSGEVLPALTRIVARKDVEREARASVERLKAHLPRQQFVQAIQARVGGRIIARETIPALRKDVTGYLYGGDRSRKMKLWKKQKRGKEKLKGMAKVAVPIEVFREILKK